METLMIASLMGENPKTHNIEASGGVVEIGLLLPANRAAALINLAKDRHESVGQVLRQLIERELSPRLSSHN
jgi:hypothetical protein